METKQMYALTFCYEGVNDCAPYAVTIAVSDSVQRLQDKMLECINEDLRIDEDNEWNDDCNFVVNGNYNTAVVLQHKSIINLYTKYYIHSVDMI